MNDSEDKQRIAEQLTLAAHHLHAKPDVINFRDNSWILENLRLALRHRLLIFTVTAVCFGITLSNSFSEVDTYTAESVVHIGTYLPQYTEQPYNDPLMIETQNVVYWRTQVSLLRSIGVARLVWQKPEVRYALNRYFQRALTSDSNIPSDALYSYLSLISTSPEPETSLVHIKVTSTDPELSALVANAHSEAYIAYQQTQRRATGEDKLTFLQKQARDLREKVGVIESQLAEYAEANGIVMIAAAQSEAQQRVAELSRQLSAATAERIRAETSWREAEEGKGLSVDDVRSVVTHHMSSVLRMKQAEYEGLSKTLTDEFPKMKELRTHIAELKRDQEKNIEKVIEGLQSTYLSKLAAEQKIRDALQNLKKDLFALSRREVQFNILKREHTTLQDLYQAVLKQVQQQQVRNESTSTGVRIIEHAAVPLVASNRGRRARVIVSLLFGPLLGFAFVRIREYLRTTIQEDEAHEFTLGISLLGVIPAAAQLGQDATGGFDYQNVSVYLDKKPLSSALQSILMRIESNHDPEKASEVITITSSRADEGKTFLSKKLAEEYGDLGKRTLLLNADLRHPNQHSTHRPYGLADYLIGTCEFETIVTRIHESQIDFINCGRSAEDPLQLIYSDRLAKLFGILRRRYDIIVVDTPSLLEHPDALLILRFVDCTLFMAQAERTERADAKAALKSLRTTRCHVAGLVLNLHRSHVGFSQKIRISGKRYDLRGSRQSGGATQVHSR